MSGWGGILAAMAQGLGTGIVKNVEQGWKSEETDKMLDWRTKESDKQRAFESEQFDKKRQHDFELEDHKSRNAISEAAARARISAQYSKSGSGGESQAQKDLTGAMQVLGVYDTQLNALNEKLANTEDKAQRDIITERINSLSAERANYLKQPGTIATFKGADQMGRALYMTSGGDVDLFSPKPATPTVTESKPVIAEPTSNMVDANGQAVNPHTVNPNKPTKEELYQKTIDSQKAWQNGGSSKYWQEVFRKHEADNKAKSNAISEVMSNANNQSYLPYYLR